jgi:hypothetical protein
LVKFRRRDRIGRLMLVRLTVDLAGPVHRELGKEYEFERGEAIRLIEAGFAMPIADVSVERAVPVSFVEHRKRKHR